LYLTDNSIQQILFQTDKAIIYEHIAFTSYKLHLPSHGIVCFLTSPRLRSLCSLLHSVHISHM